MAISLRSTTTVTSATRTNTTVTAPAGAVSGSDVILVFIDVGNSTARTVTPPSGWTTVGPASYSNSDPWAVNLYLFARVHDGAASWTFNHSSGVSDAYCEAWSGVDTTTPLDATSATNAVTGNSTSNNTATLNSVTIATTGAQEIAVRGSWDGVGITPPAGWTERLDQFGLWVGDKAAASTGATGTTSLGSGNSGSYPGGAYGPWGTIHAALRPASSDNTGTLSASVPRLTASVAATQTNPATMAASLPKTTSTIAGQSANPAALAGTLLALTAALAGTSTNPAALAASVPAVTSSVAGAAVNAASLNASVPRLTGSIVDQAVTTGTLSGSLPLLTGSITGGSANPAALAASLPRLTSSISATATNTGALVATLPVLRGQVSDQTINTAALAASVPRVTALLAGESVNPAALAAATPTLVGSCVGAMANPATLLAAVPRIVAEITGTTGSVDATPVQRPRLTLALPRSAAVLAIPRSAVALAIPTSRAEITPMDGYTRNDTGPDLTMTLTSTPAQTFTGATAAVHVRKPGGQTLTKTPQDFNTATGVVTIRWVAGDLDKAGLYEAECQVTYSNGQIQTFGPAPFVVRDELG